MFKRVKKLFAILGPGFITGASDDDPSGIATYVQSGAQFGYLQLWTAPYSFPFMTAIQEMCGRIGLVSGRGLAGVIKKHYAKPILYFAVSLLFMANTINIGANLGAMAGAATLLFNIPFIFWLMGMTVLTLLLEVFVSYKAYSRYLKYLAFSLLLYVLVVFVVKQDWSQILVSTVIPSFAFNNNYLLNIVAILGATISPYLFFWQEAEEVEGEIEKGKIMGIGRGIPKISKRDIREMRIDTVIGMFFSNMVMFFIIATFASTLYVSGINNIDTASQAAEALRPLAGDFAYLFFAAGIIGVGLLSVPILAGSASYAVSEAFGWREGFHRKFTQAHGFYAVIIIATVVGLAVNFLNIPTFKMLYYTAILNGIAAPPLLVIILLISNNRKIMGESTNPILSNILGVAITIIMSIAVLLLLFNFLF